MAADRPLFGIFLMACFCALAPVADAMAKFLGDSIPLGQLLMARFGIQAVLLVVFAWFTGRQLWLRGRLFWLALIRTVLHILGIAAMFTSLRYMPLADAVAIAFVMPFIMLILGRVFLNEYVGPHRLWACVVGFIGTLLVIQPSFAKVGYAAFLPLVVALVFSFFVLITRLIAKEVDPVGLQAINGVFGTAMLAGCFLLSSALPNPVFNWVAPNPLEWSLLVAVGVVGTVAHLLMTISLRYAPSTTLAPVQYLEIPLATLVGWIVFRDWPNGLAGVGIVVIFAAGLYVVYREQVAAKKMRPI
jgi:drug/metabolite transporter (DMT)-like permease